MLISSSSGLLTALAVIATSVAIPAPAPQQVDVCGLGLNVTVGAPKTTHNSLFNIRVIPTTAVTPSVPLGYDPADEFSYLLLGGTATTFNLTNNMLTAVLNGKENQTQDLSSNNISPLQFSEQQQCVGNEAVNILTPKSFTFSVAEFGQGAYINLEGGENELNPRAGLGRVERLGLINSGLGLGGIGLSNVVGLGSGIIGLGSGIGLGNGIGFSSKRSASQPALLQVVPA